MSEAKNPVSRLQDDPKAPEIYATAATGFFNSNGTISITLESARADHSKTPPPVNRVVVGRVVLPAGGAQALACSTSWKSRASVSRSSFRDPRPGKVLGRLVYLDARAIFRSAAQPCQ